jgi:gliding motility-associated-like protein
MLRKFLYHIFYLIVLCVTALPVIAQQPGKETLNIKSWYDSIYQTNLIPPSHVYRAGERVMGLNQQQIRNNPALNQKKPAPGKKTNSPKPVPGNNQRRLTPADSHQADALPACIDSSYRKLFYSANRIQVTWAITKTRDGGFVIGGSTRDNSEGPPWKYYGSLVKFDMNGNLLWATELRGNIMFEIYSLELYEMSDGSLLLGGEYNNALYDTVPNKNYYDGLVVKFNSTGTILWSKTFHSTDIICTNSSSIYIEGLAEGPNGEVLVTGTITNCPFPLLQWVMSLDSNGNIKWSRRFAHPTGDGEGFGVFYSNNEVLIIGRNNCYCSGSDGIIYLTFTTLDYTTGQIRRERTHRLDQPNALPLDKVFAHWLEARQLSNGNYVVYGHAFGVYNYMNDTTNHFNVVEFSKNLDFVRGYVIQSGFITNLYTNYINIDENGIACFGFYQNVGSNLTFMMGVVNPDGQFLEQRKLVYPLNTWTYNAGRFVTAPGNAFIFTQPISRIDGYPFYLEYSKFHYSDTNSTCMGIDTVFAYTEKVNYVPYNYHQWGSIKDSTLYETNHTLTQNAFGMVPEDLCPQTSFCDTFRLRPVDTICSINDSFIVTAFKNRECGSWVSWSMDTTAIESLRQLNDSTVIIKMRKERSGYLHGSLMGKCGLLEDSVRLVFLNSPGEINLGPDTSICPSNTLALNARKGFLRYQWQDGSTDSLFTVTQPGIYHVAGFDACGNAYRDTILISAAPPIPFSVGSDRTKCNNDTIQLRAPEGFMNYSWSPNYNISATNTPNVIVNPLFDTVYTISAEKTPGCFAYDTVRVAVNRSPVINLGNDTSFCTGNSVVLDAGTGFVQYQWSNGQQGNQQITISTPGQYSIIATDDNGCTSRDTLRVLQVYALPVVNLMNNPNLCEGTIRTLDAGAGHTYYVWSNGSLQQSIQVNDVGVYWVSITDRNGCSGFDTVTISNLLPVPKAFLPPDTSICSYGKMELKANQPYMQYQWSTGSGASTITVNNPGTYWLEVTDQNQCKGRDSVILIKKECLEGFYVPNAFTPDKNGRNDLFRPLLFGNIADFHFTIYNRWGQMVYDTKELYKGWDGTINGVQAPAGQYVWKCIYRLNGQNEEMKKGTVVLIR